MLISLFIGVSLLREIKRDRETEREREKTKTISLDHNLINMILSNTSASFNSKL